MRTFRFLVSEEFLRDLLGMPATSEIVAISTIEHSATFGVRDFQFWAIDTAVPDKEPSDELGMGLSTFVTPILHKIEWDWNIQGEE